MEGLEHLGKQSQDAIDQVDAIPWEGGDALVTLNCTEFTSHCPVTKQPDFAKLVIQYAPNEHLVETKSLKLYLWKYRHRAQFNEKLTDEIANDLFKQLKPHWLRVEGEFNTRGGIQVCCAVSLGAR